MNILNTALKDMVSSLKIPLSLDHVKNTLSRGIIAGLFLTGALWQMPASAQYSTSEVIQNPKMAMPGMEKAHILNVQIVTDGPANLSQINFNTFGTNEHSNIVQARLFYSNASTFDVPLPAAAEIGSAVPSPEGDFSFSGLSVNLVTGTNHFWLAYDILDDYNAIGDSVDAECLSFVIDGSTFVPEDPAPAGARNILHWMEYFYCPYTANDPRNFNIGLSRLEIADTLLLKVISTAGVLENWNTTVITLVQDVRYPFSYRGGTGNSQNERIYIDWNGDGFYESSEMVHQGATPASMVSYGILNIPCNVKPGLKRLRFAADSGVPSAPCSGTNGAAPTNGLGTGFEMTINVIIAPPALADFQIGTMDYRDAFIDYKNTSPGLKLGYNFSWDYTNDGTTDATTADGRTSYSTNGTKQVKLHMAREFCGDPRVDSVIKSIQIVEPPAFPLSEFIADRNITNPILTVNFKDLSNNGANKWHWKITPEQIEGSPTFSYVNGTDSNSQHPQVKFNILGYYTVSLWTENALGNGSYIVKEAYVENINSYSMCSVNSTEDAFGFLADEGGPNANYPDGSNKLCRFLINPCASSISFRFLSFDMSRFQVTNCFLPGTSTLQPFDNVKIFDGMDATGAPLHTAAGWPDGFSNNPGNVALLQMPPVLTANSGSMYIEYYVNCAFNGAGFFAEWSSEPDMVDAPVPSFVSSDTAYVGAPYVFDNTSTGEVDAYSWDFEDDRVPDATTKDVEITFTEPGVQTVRLTLTRCRTTHTFAKQVVVFPITKAPVADFRATREIAIVSDTVRLMDISENGATSWNWSITPSTGFIYVNGTNASSRNPFILFQQVGSYTVSLTAANSFGNDVETKTNYIGVFAYCAPDVVNLGNDVGISRVQFGAIDNTSPIGESAYSYYRQSAQVELGATYPIVIERNSAFNNVNRKVWIDFNKNGSFEDAGEEVAYEASNSSLVFNGLVTIPKTASLGLTRMRVGVSSENNDNSPCGPNVFGEFEDYDLDIIKDITKPVITLIGDDPIVIELGFQYVDPGATAIDNSDGDITDKIVAYDNVDPAVGGIYRVVYKVTDEAGNEADSVVRTVIVDTDISGPTITLTGGDTIRHMVNTPFDEPGYTAMDFADGDVTSSVVVGGTVNPLLIGTYYLTYNAEDLSGNQGTKVRVVIVDDYAAPTVTLIGVNPLSIDYRAPFLDPGVNISDNYYTSGLFAEVVGHVNPDVMGVYSVTYHVKDLSGNEAAPLTRTIIVEDISAPVVSLLGSDTVIVDVYGNYIEMGSSVQDNHTENLTASVSGTVNVNVIGDYTLSYTATDSSGNTNVPVKRVVRVVDRERPVIALIGDAVIHVKRWVGYNDPGVIIYDNYYSNATLQALLEKPATFATHDPGLFQYCYNVTDPSGNKAQQVCRLVQIDSFGTSVSRFVLENSIDIYPNPTKGQFNIDINTELSGNLEIAVYNAHGALVQEVTKGDFAGKSYAVDLTGQAAGVYYVRVVSGGETVTKKIAFVH
jgi:PKD repeat protein